MRASFRLAVLAATLCLAMTAPAAAQAAPIDDKTLEKAHSDFLEDSVMQTERPESEPVVEEPNERRESGWLRAIAEFIGNILSALGPVFRVIFYLMIGGIVLAILYFVFGEALNLRFDGKKDKDDAAGDDVLPEFRPDAIVARSLLEEADALAKAGRYAEAVHLLLFRSIEDIQQRRAGGLPRSLTAREIGGLSMLPVRARQALAPIIAIVERSFFGGRDVDEHGWTSARASYEAFAFGET